MVRGRFGLLSGIFLAFLVAYRLAPAAAEFGDWAWRARDGGGGGDGATDWAAEESEQQEDEASLGLRAAAPLSGIWKLIFPDFGRPAGDQDTETGNHRQEYGYLSVERRAVEVVETEEEERGGYGEGDGTEADEWLDDNDLWVGEDEDNNIPAWPEDEEDETDPFLPVIAAENTLLVNLKETYGNLEDLKAAISAILDIPLSNIQVNARESHDDIVGLYFVRPAADPAAPGPGDLLPASAVEDQLASAGGNPLDPLETSLIVDSVQPQVKRSSLNMASYSPSSDLWNQSFVPYVIAASAVVLVGGVILTVWCCSRARSKPGQSLPFPTQESALLTPAAPHPQQPVTTLPQLLPHHPHQQQICLFPAARPSVNGATAIQPDVSQISTSKACGGCGTPIRLPGTPLAGTPLSGSTSASGTGSPAYSSSLSGTPIPGTPVHTPPLRIKSRLGLLERRGSNASLTIDLGTGSSDPAHMGSPPKESSAEEYLLSAGNRMSRKQLRQCLRNIKALYEEFWEIPMNHPDKITVPGSGMKNRYRTIIPNEHSRIKLPEIDADPLSEYINANYIRGYAGEPKAYIATQGPMSNTVHDFWRMVWQEKAPIIVMITKLKEKNKAKCECYLPETHGVYGPIEVITENISDKDGYMVRELTVKYGDETHPVLHYWYTAWPDHKAPDTARQLLGLVTEVDIRRRGPPPESKPKGPVIVHCSAGIGRTGCFLANSVGMLQLREEHMVDVLGIVCNMRLDRGGMVQTNEQYEFVHQALVLYEQKLPDRPPTGD